MGKLIHIGMYFVKGHWKNLFLRKMEDSTYAWFEEAHETDELPTNVSAENPEEALRLAHRQWRSSSFRTLRCGYRFTLPERDEIGTNALFHQMVASYATGNGVYFDDELGHQCIVREISQQAFEMWKRLEAQKRL
ncbi:MAG: hypothetical protein Q8K75_08080 [Chlamydiales bacterium]|nr:hypothetical protein [Chlamydiales bacterium]